MQLLPTYYDSAYHSPDIVWFSYLGETGRIGLLGETGNCDYPNESNYMDSDHPLYTDMEPITRDWELGTNLIN